MNINTKFDIGSEVYFLEGNRIYKGIIHTIDICTGEKNITETYQIDYKNDRGIQNRLEISSKNLYKDIEDIWIDLLDDYEKRNN